MRIISKFHDYYDSIQGFGFDPTVVYIRKRKEIYTNKFPIDIKSSKLDYLFNNGYSSASFTNSGEIFFCGNRYRFVYIQNDYSKKQKYFFSFEAFDSYIHNKLSKQIIKKYTNKERYSKKSYRTIAQKYFVPPEDNNFENNIKLHEEFDTPVFAVNTKRSELYIVINPILREMSFQSVFDPYSAFQEIDMFLSGIMQSKEKNTIQISDKMQKYKKGFDNMSFKPKMRAKYLEKIK